MANIQDLFKGVVCLLLIHIKILLAKIRAVPTGPGPFYYPSLRSTSCLEFPRSSGSRLVCTVAITYFVSNVFFERKYWGQAYGDTNGTTSGLYTFKSFATAEHEIPLDPTFNLLHVVHPHYHAASTLKTTEYNWPRAQDHPLFYVGIYAAISLGAGLVNITGAITQYTGALRASRVLFEKLLASVVRATMRWHDVTPQGMNVWYRLATKLNMVP